MPVPTVPGKRAHIQPVDTDITGTTLTTAINDRIRRINQALAEGGPPAAPAPAPAPGPAGSGDHWIINEIPGGTVDNSNTAFTLAQTPDSPDDVLVFLNGVLQHIDGDDITVSGNTITFKYAPQTSDYPIRVTYRVTSGSGGGGSGGGGGVSSVTASAPLTSSGGTTPNIALTVPLAVGYGGSGSASPALVAGSGISVTGSWPNQTITATGGGGGGGISGSGTANYVPVFTGSTALGNSVMYQSGGNVGINQTSPMWPLDVNGGMHAWFANVADNTGANSGITFSIIQSTATGTNYGIQATANGAATYNFGGQFSAFNAANNVGVYCDCGPSSGGGTAMGLRVAGPAAGPNSWSMFVDSTAPVYIAGKVGIGTGSPVTPLDVNTGGGIHIASGAPASPTDVLSNNAGVLTWNGTAIGASPTLVEAIGCGIDGHGAVPATGLKVKIQVPYNCVINGWTMLADVSGSAQVTIKTGSYASWPTTASIVASAPLVISSAQKNTSTALTGWAPALSAGDILEFWLDSISTITNLMIQLKVTRT